MEITVFIQRKLNSLSSVSSQEEKEILVFEDFQDFEKDFQNLPEYEQIWIDVETPNMEDFVPLAQQFTLHELAVEDCFTVGHFPKIEEYSNFIFLMLRGLKSSSEFDEIRAEEDLEEEYNSEKLTRGLGMFIGKDFLITHRVSDVPWLDAFIRQLKNTSDNLQDFSPHDLSLRICNTLSLRFLRGVNYFEDDIDKLEDDIIKRPEKFDMLSLLDIKRDLNILISISRDQKTIFSRLSKESQLVPDRASRRYYKNIEERVSTTLQSLQRLIDNLSSVRDVYLAITNIRLNDVLKVLAVITTLTAPLSLLAAIYGMNFDFMPLQSEGKGFFIVLAAMLFVASLLLLFFRKKKWI